MTIGPPPRPAATARISWPEACNFASVASAKAGVPAKTIFSGIAADPGPVDRAEMD